jgi:hypothetical protein
MMAAVGARTAIAAASAALLGLLYVVVSINAAAALGPGEPVSRRLTEQAFQNYLAVLMVALLSLFAGISTVVFGAVTLAATASWSIWVIIRFAQTVMQGGERRAWLGAVRRHLSSLIGFGMLLSAALRMALGWGEDYNWLAASTLVLLFSATAVSWELLNRFARRKPS